MEGIGIKKMLLYVYVTIVVVVSVVHLGYNIREFDTYSLMLSLFGFLAALLGFVVSSENFLKVKRSEEKEKNTSRNSNIEGKKQLRKEEATPTERITAGGLEAIEDPIAIEQDIIQPRAYGYSDTVSLRRRDVIMHFRKTEQRLKNEIDSLKRRANINMIIGAVIAIVGGVGLVAFIIGEQDQEGIEISTVIIHWITRLSLVTFVGIFAFFFLKMYKTELLSIQYYQDELTSIESRKIALLFSIIHDNQDDISKTIDCLVNIDRNFKLDSSQTTVDLEKLKTENNIIKSQIDSVMEVFKGALTFKVKDES